jgi:hypothetical protein
MKFVVSFEIIIIQRGVGNDPCYLIKTLYLTSSCVNWTFFGMSGPV